jgi:hypothetical protein
LFFFFFVKIEIIELINASKQASTKVRKEKKMIRNPLTNRFMRVGGRTYKSVMSLLPECEFKPSARPPKSLKVSKDVKAPRMAGALMVDRENDWDNYFSPLAPEWRVTLGQRRIRNKSLRSSNLTTYKGARRSLKNKYLTRPSPNLSATLFTPGTRRKGNDKKMWVITKTRLGVHRWTRI